jgi:hypothetical protein
MSQETITLPKSVVQAIFALGVFFGSTGRDTLATSEIETLILAATQEKLQITKRDVEKALATLEELDILFYE